MADHRRGACGEAFGAIMAHAGGARGAVRRPAVLPVPRRDGATSSTSSSACRWRQARRPAAGVDLEEVPGGRVATHRAPRALPERRQGLRRPAGVDGRQRLPPGGAPREIYLNDPATVPDAELLTEVDWPIADAMRTARSTWSSSSGRSTLRRAKHPAIVEVPELSFLMIDGRGDPTARRPTRTLSGRCTASPTRSSSR